MESLLDTVKEMVRRSVKSTSTVVDFTMGNGSDTLFLRSLVPSGKVFAFDVQPQALENTKKRLQEQNIQEGVTLILDCHSNCDKYIFDTIDGGIFNLGYLPHCDKKITTKKETTLLAIEKAMGMLSVEGILVIVVYPGHEEGKMEGKAIEKLLTNLDVKRYDALIHRLINVPECPYIFAVQRRR